MNEPNEPHDEWGRPLEKIKDSKKGFFTTIQDVFFYTLIGLIFLIIFGWIMLVFLPYYLGRQVWEKIETWI